MYLANAKNKYLANVLASHKWLILTLSPFNILHTFCSLPYPNLKYQDSSKIIFQTMKEREREEGKEEGKEGESDRGKKEEKRERGIFEYNSQIFLRLRFTGTIIIII